MRVLRTSILRCRVVPPQVCPVGKMLDQDTDPPRFSVDAGDGVHSLSRSEPLHTRDPNAQGGRDLRAPIHTIKGSATVVTAWLIRLGEDFPRLTTCYIIRRR